MMFLFPPSLPTFFGVSWTSCRNWIICPMEFLTFGICFIMVSICWSIPCIFYKWKWPLEAWLKSDLSVLARMFRRSLILHHIQRPAVSGNTTCSNATMQDPTDGHVSIRDFIHCGWMVIFLFFYLFHIY